MRTALCDDFGIEFPIFAFSHCRDVVAAVSRAGGLGVLGALAFSPEQLEVELRWIDEHIDGRPYGVDVIVPASSAGADLSGPDLADQLAAMIPDGHRRYVEEVLDSHGVPPLPAGAPRPTGLLGWTDQGARSQVEVAARNFCFTTGCVSASSVVSQTEPHHTASAPSASAAAS